MELLADRSNPTEREVYAGRLAEETNISKTAILAQLDDAVKRSGSKKRRDQQRALLHSGEMDTIHAPYQAGGRQALGAASAEQRLIVAMLREPGYIPLVRSRLPEDEIIMPDLKEAYAAIYRCQEQGITATLPVLAQMVSEKTMTELSRLSAQYSDVNATREDVELYLDRIAASRPKSSMAGKMSPKQLNDYLEQLRAKKQGNDPADGE